MLKIHRLVSLIPKVVFILTIISLYACGGGQVQKDAPPEEAPQPPLVKKYDQIVLMDYEGTPEVVRDYPGVLEECRASTMTALLTKNVFKKVDKFAVSQQYGPNTLIIKAKVTEMRMVSSAARIWGGALAGSSYMNLDVRLLDGATRQEVRSKPIFSANNPFAAAWIGGSSDRTLPSDMGKIIAENLFSIMPK